MKLTREQVSQLSDVELNRAMIWFYPVDGMILHKRGTYEGCDYFHHRQGIGYSWLNYLTDYNLTMPLAFENKLGTKFYADGVAIVEDDYNVQAYSENINPLRAICEVLLMIAMEREA